MLIGASRKIYKYDSPIEPVDLNMAYSTEAPPKTYFDTEYQTQNINATNVKKKKKNVKKKKGTKNSAESKFHFNIMIYFIIYCL